MTQTLLCIPTIGKRLRSKWLLTIFWCIIHFFGKVTPKSKGKKQTVVYLPIFFTVREALERRTYNRYTFLIGGTDLSSKECVYLSSPFNSGFVLVRQALRSCCRYWYYSSGFQSFSFTCWSTTQFQYKSWLFLVVYYWIFFSISLFYIKEDKENKRFRKWTKRSY